MKLVRFFFSGLLLVVSIVTGVGAENISESFALEGLPPVVPECTKLASRSAGGGKTERFASMQEHLKDMKIHKTSDSPTGVYIPENLADALKELDYMLPEAAKADIRSVPIDLMIAYHRGFGTWIRNNWGLRGGERLAKWFNTIGIRHPDDMSGIIFDSYWSKLNGKPDNLDEKVAHYKAYWDSMRPIVDVSVKLTPALLKSKLVDRKGKTSTLRELTGSADLSLLAFVSKSDVQSPLIIEAFKTWSSKYKASQLQLVVLMPDKEPGGTITNLGKIDEVAKVYKSGTATSSGLKQFDYPGAMLHEVKSLFKLDSVIIPQTLVVKRDNTIVKRINGFGTKPKAAEVEAVIEALLSKQSDSK
ncbi:MAG: hypothetical protein K8F91_13285 [Candidatus Obscuribacterales bacterium]|nr:hypothetical protein [Candidatus Obscuribacterales bacterium]